MIFVNLKKVIYSFILTFAIVFNASSAFAIDTQESTAFASFVIGLINSTQSSNSKDAICIYGNDEITQAILSQSKSVTQFEKLSKKMSSCKAVYIAKDMKRGLRSEISEFQKNKLLTIAIFDGFTEMGGGIQVQMGRRSFELIINSAEIKNSGARLSGLFTSLIIN